MAETIKQVTSTANISPKVGAIQTDQMSVYTPPNQTLNPAKQSTIEVKTTPQVPQDPVTPKTPSATSVQPYVQSVAITPDIQAEMDRFPGITAEALVATHTTNLPTQAADISLGWGCSTSGQGLYHTPVMVSISNA